jgi:hypothetical protein
VGQFEIPVNSNQERISHKGAKAQRKNAKLLNATRSLRPLLCAFARTCLFSSSFETDPLLGGE